MDKQSDQIEQKDEVAKEKISVKDKKWVEKHPIFSVLLALVFVGIFINTLNGKNGTDFTNTQSSPASSTVGNTPTSAPSTPVTYKIGQAARDGKFEFVVNKIGCGETSVGSQYSKLDAQGQFCRLNVSVKNIGNEAQTLSHSDQFLFSSDGKKFSASSSAAIYATSGQSAISWYSSINPGNTVSGDIFFDIPKDVTPFTAELHDSSLSGGVMVSVR